MEMTPTGDSSILAGKPDDKGGYVNGKGQSARFNAINEIIVDKSDNIFVADAYNNSVRKIMPNGDVSTFLDLNKIPGMSLSAAYLASLGDSLSKCGRMPETLALDDQHNLYITASLGYTDKYLFKVTPSGQVITLWSVTGPNKVVYFRHGHE